MKMSLTLYKRKYQEKGYIGKCVAMLTSNFISNNQGPYYRGNVDYLYLIVIQGFGSTVHYICSIKPNMHTWIQIQI